MNKLLAKTGRTVANENITAVAKHHTLTPHIHNDPYAPFKLISNLLPTRVIPLTQLIQYRTHHH